MTWTVRAPKISVVQRSPCNACATVLFFLIRGPTVAQRQGATSASDFPSSQRSDQNKAVWPSPKSTDIEAWNIASTMGSFSSGSRCHDRATSVRIIHSHLMRSAYPKCCKSMMPKPPSSGGRQTLGQASKQCLPLADCSFPEKCSSNIVNTFDGPRREANSKGSMCRNCR